MCGEKSLPTPICDLVLLRVRRGWVWGPSATDIKNSWSEDSHFLDLLVEVASQHAEWEHASSMYHGTIIADILKEVETVLLVC